MSNKININCLQGITFSHLKMLPYRGAKLSLDPKQDPISVDHSFT